MLSLGFADNIKPFSMATDKYIQELCEIFFSDVPVVISNESNLLHIVMLT